MTNERDRRQTIATTDDTRRVSRRRALQLLTAVGGVATGPPTVGATGLSGTMDRSGPVNQRRGETTWTQQQKLVADDGDADDFFGPVTIDGSTALIGAAGDENQDPNGENAGSAYVFERSGDTWTQQQKLAADDGDSSDLFGWDVALNGSTAVIGARNDEDPNGENAGSAYVFERSGDTWTQQAKLVAADGDSFGRSVALAESTALIGAAGDENQDPNGENAGSAYVFTGPDGGGQSLPGPGIVGGLAGLGGAAYWLTRREDGNHQEPGDTDD